MRSKILVRQFDKETCSLNFYRVEIYLVTELKDQDNDLSLVIMKLYIFLKLVDGWFYLYCEFYNAF